MAVLPPLVRKVRHWLRRQGVEPGGIVVAVSGGPDSVALLRVLAAMDEERAGLTVAHLNHQLRGTESDADEEFVRLLSTSLHVTFRGDRLDAAALARRAERENLEAAARRARYAWLGRVARETGSRWVATGHTANDQAETVLHRLLRGTGLKGLRGIAARRELEPGVTLIRPLLHVPRTEVIAYLGSESQNYRTDSSNFDPKYTRNRIRHELLPLLVERFNPAVVPVLCRLAQQAHAVYNMEQAQAMALLTKTELPRAGTMVVLDRNGLADAPRQLIREVFRHLWERENWPQGRMSFSAWDRLAGVALAETGGVDLPGGIRVLGRERVVQIGRSP